jgi:hypothetical protein
MQNVPLKQTSSTTPMLPLRFPTYPGQRFSPGKERYPAVTKISQAGSITSRCGYVLLIRARLHLLQCGDGRLLTFASRRVTELPLVPRPCRV